MKGIQKFGMNLNNQYIREKRFCNISSIFENLSSERVLINTVFMVKIKLNVTPFQEKTHRKMIVYRIVFIFISDNVLHNFLIPFKIIFLI